MAPAPTPASKLRNYFQVNRYGDPIPGTNVRIGKKPTSFGKGQKWVQFVPVNMAYPCCPTGRLKITSIGKKWRYYVRLRNASVIDEQPSPIPGTLEKHMWPPTSYGWQEVVGTSQCERFPQFNATYAWTSTDPLDINLAVLLGLKVPDTWTFVPSSGSTDNSLMGYTLLSDGSLDVTQATSPLVTITDTVDLQYTNGDCTFTFRMTLVFTP